MECTYKLLLLLLSLTSHIVTILSRDQVPEVTENIAEVTYPSLSLSDYHKMYTEMKQSFPKLNNETLKNQVKLSTFFNFNLENLERMIYVVKTNATDFLDELKTIRSSVTLITTKQYNVGDIPDLYAQIARMSSGWEDIISILKRLKNEWDFLIGAISNNHGQVPSELEKEEIKILRGNLNSIVDKKAQEIQNALNKFKDGTIRQVPYLDGKTTDLSTFAWSVISYMRELLLEPNGPVKRSSVPTDETDEISKMFSEISATSLDSQTKNELLALSVFFRFSLESFFKFSSTVVKFINYFVNEFKSSVVLQGMEQPNFTELYEIEDQITQLTSSWEDIVYRLATWKKQWENFTPKIASMNPSAVKEKVKSVMREIKKWLNEFENGTVKEIRYLGEKSTNVSTIAWNIVTYSGEVLKSNFTEDD